MPDMKIEPGDKTDEPIRTRGWTYWHHLFHPRNLVFFAILRERINEQGGKGANAPLIGMIKALDWGNRLCYYGTGAARESISHLFSNQAFNPFLNYGIWASRGLSEHITLDFGKPVRAAGTATIATAPASAFAGHPDLAVTDPPYADAINYHEITEFFIAWLCRNPPSPFDQWTWDFAPRTRHQGQGRNLSPRYGRRLWGHDPAHAGQLHPGGDVHASGRRCLG